MRIQRERVVEAAWTLLDESGLEGLTMRALAQALSIQAPSLYWHFPGKQALLDAMADALLEDVGRAWGEAMPWEAMLRALAVELRRAFLRHRDGARVYAGTYVVSENTLRIGDALVRALVQAGFTPQEAGWGHFTILNYVLGFTIEEQSFTASGVAGTELVARLRKESSGRFPHLSLAMDDIVDTDFERRFAFGLDLLLTGMRGRSRPSAP